eukprot:7533362-Karenia_brevis.AAC.1
MAKSLHISSHSKTTVKRRTISKSRTLAMTDVCKKHPYMLTMLSFLQMHAILPQTAMYYMDMIAEFSRWLKTQKISISTAIQLDQSLVRYFDMMAMEGGFPSMGDKVLAALLHLSPTLGSNILTAFPMASRSLRGWHRLMPARTVQPLPFASLM